MTQEQIREAIKFATSNMDEIIASQKVACYYCKRIYSSKEITDICEDKNGPTAVCAYCHVDSVLPDSAPFEFSNDVLTELHNYWFSFEKDNNK